MTFTHIRGTELSLLIDSKNNELSIHGLNKEQLQLISEILNCKIKIACGKYPFGYLELKSNVFIHGSV
jgi:hypothetical protein